MKDVCTGFLLFSTTEKAKLFKPLQRKTADDTSTEKLVIKTGKLKKDSPDMKTNEVINPSNSFMAKLHVNMQYCF